MNIAIQKSNDEKNIYRIMTVPELIQELKQERGEFIVYVEFGEGTKDAGEM